MGFEWVESYCNAGVLEIAEVKVVFLLRLYWYCLEIP